MKHYWFKAKRYGWGWYPSSWQGWAVTLVYVLLLTYRVKAAEQRSVLEMLFITTLLVIICYVTGEKPGWRWGRKK